MVPLIPILKIPFADRERQSASLRQHWCQLLAVHSIQLNAEGNCSDVPSKARGLFNLMLGSCKCRTIPPCWAIVSLSTQATSGTLYNPKKDLFAVYRDRIYCEKPAAGVGGIDINNYPVHPSILQRPDGGRGFRFSEIAVFRRTLDLGFVQGANARMADSSVPRALAEPSPYASHPRRMRGFTIHDRFSEIERRRDVLINLLQPE
ncbi:unnamed protein product [Nesidiocoris tenuis]|uniref:Uncharacterized protein n=1 Tax=Nesidiocoris tenuis TaxID=355587 RepID=A0A6H5G1U1_9HEMI|nr:unnamed protein product [Nesidiocoris tenuis]